MHYFINAHLFDPLTIKVSTILGRFWSLLWSVFSQETPRFEPISRPVNSQATPLIPQSTPETPKIPNLAVRTTPMITPIHPCFSPDSPMIP